MDKPVQSNLPGIKKAAVLAVMLGEELTGEVFRELEEEEVHKLSLLAHAFIL